MIQPDTVYYFKIICSKVKAKILYVLGTTKNIFRAYKNNEGKFNRC